jgi:hypothetical protein
VSDYESSKKSAKSASEALGSNFFLKTFPGKGKRRAVRKQWVPS